MTVAICWQYQLQTYRYPGGVSPSLPGAVGEADPPAVTAIAAPTSFPLVSMTQRAAGGQALGLGDLELTSLPSCKWQ